MHQRQRGELSLLWVAIFSALFALAAMAALFSMRYERNLFAEGWAKARSFVGASPAAQVVESAKQAVGAAPSSPVADAGGALRKCTIGGHTVISNTECTDKNPTSKVIEIHDTKGFEAPKKPAPADSAPTSDPALDKVIEKNLH